jgi:hypothetical protein
VSERKSQDLLTRLVEGGISPRRARRILLELEDHRLDLVAERRELGATLPEARAEADARLGSDDMLVAHLLARPELRSWVRRRPWAAFALLPMMSLAIAFIGSLLVLVGICHVIRAQLGPLTEYSPAVRRFGDIADVYLIWAIPVCVAAALGALAIRHRAAPLWPCIGIALVCIAGALTNFALDTPPAAARMAISAGIGIGGANALPALIRATSTSALVMLPYLWWRRAQRGELHRAS